MNPLIRTWGTQLYCLSHGLATVLTRWRISGATCSSLSERACEFPDRWFLKALAGRHSELPPFGPGGFPDPPAVPEAVDLPVATSVIRSARSKHSRGLAFVRRGRPGPAAQPCSPDEPVPPTCIPVRPHRSVRKQPVLWPGSGATPDSPAASRDSYARERSPRSSDWVGRRAEPRDSGAPLMNWDRFGALCYRVAPPRWRGPGSHANIPARCSCRPIPDPVQLLF